MFGGLCRGSPGSQNGAFGEPSLCPAKKRGLLTTTAKMRSCVLTGETRVLAAQTPRNDENDEMVGFARAKAWFTKGTVFVP